MDMISFPNCLVFLVYVISVISASSHSLIVKCGKNARWRLCPNSCQPTCDSTETYCPYVNKCHGGCECRSGYILDSARVCVQTQECQKTIASKPIEDPKTCDENSVFKTSPCVQSCAYMYLQNTCVQSSVSGCECLQGYFLNSKGKCVKDYECTETEVICPKNQTFSTCASSCPLTCENVSVKRNDCNFNCNTRCDCNPGYVLNSMQQCIVVTDCNPKEVKCPANMVFQKCAEQKTCENIYEIVQPTENCVPDCACVDDTVFDSKTGKCIETFDCENSLQNQACRSLDPNMKFFKSHKSVAPTCENPDPNSDDTRSGCFCKEGFILSNNVCISKENC